MRDEALERTLPHNLEAERSVLGAILVENSHFDIAAEKIRAEDFFRDAHRRIFLRMADMSIAGIGIDFVTLKEALNAAGELDEVGGPAYVASLADGVPRGTNVPYYAAIVREHALRRELIYAANQIATSAYDCEDSAADVLAAADRKLVDLQSGRGFGSLVSLRDGISGLMSDLDARTQQRGTLTGIDIGFESLNLLTNGWQPGNLIILAARPSIGKTALATDCTLAAARGGKRVAFFSLEMERRELEYRIVSSLSGVDLSRLLAGILGGPDWPKLSAAFEAMHALPIEIDDGSAPSMWELRSKCRRLKSEKGLDLVVVDYVQLMPGSVNRRGATRNEEVTDISRRMKLLARELKVPVILLSQLSRANENRADPRPRLSDLRESGALEQDGDVVVLLHRRNYAEGGTTQAILAKQRNGPTGTVNLTLQKETVHFIDGGEDPPEPPPEERRGRRRRSKPEPEPQAELPVDGD